MPHFKNTNNDLFWLDEGEDASKWLPNCTEITDEEADAIRVAKAQAAQAALTYAEKRAAEYPPLTDYLDGVVKGDQAQIDAYIAACQAVKAKYPKGGE
jgi:hypothetical protein